MAYLLAFIAGFISTLVFIQIGAWFLYKNKLWDLRPWDLTPVPPFQIPSVINISFWGGLWGILLWAFIHDTTGSAYWIKSLLFGALAPSLVLWFIVFPLKGLGPAAGWNKKIIYGALLLNAIWGVGTAFLMWLLRLMSMV